LTCNTCAPVGAATSPFTEVPFTIVVFVLLSREYPIADIACEEHGEVVACNANGEDTCAPVAGLVTVTAENTGTAETSNSKGQTELTLIPIGICL
jgi:hypothetical protein